MLDKNADLDAVYRASGLVLWHKVSIKPQLIREVFATVAM
jgi:hypothetical protein